MKIEKRLNRLFFIRNEKAFKAFGPCKIEIVTKTILTTSSPKTRKEA